MRKQPAMRKLDEDNPRRFLTKTSRRRRPRNKSRAPARKLRSNPFKQNEFADRLLEILPVAAWVKSPSGVMLACNTRCAADFGVSREELVGRLSPEYRLPELREQAAKTDADLIRSRKTLSYEARQLRDDGTYRYGIVTKTPFFNPDGSVGGIIGIVTDITERKHAEEAAQLAVKVFENSVEGIYIANSRNCIIRINPAFTAITGYSEADVHGRDPRMLGPVQEDPEITREITDAVTRRGIWRGEFTNRRKSGELFPVLASIIALRDAQGRTTNYVGIFRDITERKESEERMRWLAHHDFLTGLANRSLLEDRFDQAIRRARRDSSRLALFLVDLNGFKPVNDSHGHQVGDHVLKITARRLTECVRQTDTVARIGGDEFVIVASDIGSRANVDKIGHKIVSKICEPVEMQSRVLTIGASVGVSLFPDHGETATVLRELADATMYGIKETGKSGYAIHE